MYDWTRSSICFLDVRVLLVSFYCTYILKDMTTFHTDPENQFEAVIAAKDRIFSGPPYPNWTALGVGWLAGFDFEIKVIARIPDW